MQESLTNARRHAAGAPVHIALAYQPTGLALAIENARTHPPNGNGAPPGVGIVGMTERAAAIGGTLRAGPSSAGFRVDAYLPYGNDP